MALVSPGLQLTVTDESQYISNAIGTTPLVLLATAQDKTINGSAATGTSAANAGKLQIFGSQRELTTALGTPTFQQSSAGTPLHGDERNEYGLMAAYSALGVNNQVYAVRADIDLNELAGTSVRPTASAADSTYWLDLADTSWGIYEWSADTQSFTEKTPTVITSAADVTTSTQGTLTAESTPVATIGSMGSYAVVATTSNNRTFYKAGVNVGTVDPFSIKNTWTLLGTPNWYAAHPATIATVSSPTVTVGANLRINTTLVNVSVSGTSLANVVSAINSAAITGVKADALNNKLAIYSDGTSTNSQVVIATGYNGAGNTTVFTALGLTAGTYNSAAFTNSDFANVPYWTTADATAAPNGSAWLKTSATGGGANFTVKKYNATTDTWVSQATSVYTTQTAADYALDPTGGGKNIASGTIFFRVDVNPNGTATLGYAGYRPKRRAASGTVSATGNALGATPFSSGSSFTLNYTTPGSATGTSATITLGGTGASAFVNAINAANTTYVSAALTSTNAITLTHSGGGEITLIVIAGQPNIPSQAGFADATLTNVYVYGTAVNITGWEDLTYTYSATQPVADPANGTYWYYSDPTVVDVMINTGTAWKGYKNVSSDLRGYNLGNTDPYGVIAAASAPTTQTDDTALVSGDLWLDTSDLENWPKLTRWNGTSWAAIDNTDQVSGAGILFADARWDSAGTSDPAAGDATSIVTLLTSDYLDLDAPNPELYPRGMLLLNTRRSGYNVKKYVENYFTIDTNAVDTWSSSTTYTIGQKVYSGSTIYVAILGGTNQNPSSAPTYWTALTTSAWVTASGLKTDGSPYAGHKSQRQIIVAALQSAVASNTEIREEQFKYSLICAPGYPELIDEMVSLNNDRANTAFIIGDTPMDLSTNAVSIINWSNNTNGDGLSTADPYLGVYFPAGLSSDLGGNTIMVPPSHMALRTYLYNDNVAFPWFAPAGTRRGLVSNATDLGYLNRTTGEFTRTGVNQALRDTLYANKINPITIIPGIGLVVFGQKTRNPTTASLDRINVSRLVNYIRTIFSSAGNAFLFEPNDKITRDQFAAILNRSLNDLVSKRGIYDYLVVCDTTNNTPDRIANNQLYADVAIEPMKDVEFIYIPIRLYNPGDIATLGSK
jgi:hypothetical protein